MASELGQAVGESAAVFLFETFHNKDHVGTEETRAIKHMFGPFPSSAAEAACASVGRLVALLGDSRVEDFIQSQRSCRNLDRSTAFGRNIAFSHDGYTLDPLEGLPFSGIQEESASLDFINFFNNQKSGKKDISEEAPSSTGSPLTPGDGSILRTEVDKYLCGGNMMSSNPEELCTSLFEMLASHRSNDELQNEVCTTGLFVLTLKVRSIYNMRINRSHWKVRNSFYAEVLTEVGVSGLFLCSHIIFTSSESSASVIFNICLHCFFMWTNQIVCTDSPVLQRLHWLLW